MLSKYRIEEIERERYNLQDISYLIYKSMGNERTERIIIIDALKTFAIILVVLGHCIQFGSGQDFLNNERFYDNWLFKIIYSFHMPLFMLISGYLFSCSYKGDWVNCIKKRICHLVLPMFVWSILPIFKNFVLDAGTYLWPDMIIYYFRTSFLNFWFIWAVFWCSCLVVIINKLFKDSLYVYIFLFVISFIIPDVANLALYKYMYPYFVIGYMFKKYNSGSLKYILYNWRIIACLLVLYVGLLLFFNYETYIYTTGHSLIGRDILSQLKNDIHRYIIGLVGSALVILIFVYIDTLIEKCQYKISTIARETMGIYIISTFINSNLLLPLSLSLSGINYLIIIFETIGILTVSLLLIRIINQSQILKRLLLGK